MHKTKYLVLGLALLAVHSCQEEEPMTPSTGFLRVNVSAITVSSSPTGGRTMDVSTDDFIVKIFRAGEDEPVHVFNPWSGAPDEIELETGEYYVEAQNLDPVPNAAFEQPWYYGVSDHFTIDKEELKTIDVDCSMANFKVAFVYSQNVIDDFTTWEATATLINEGASLTWVKGDEREGYFITSPLAVAVNLQYTKLSGELITRTFTSTLNNPQPATLYRFNVDASLNNGQIQININVDDSFETEEIQLGDAEEPDDEEVTDADGNTYPTILVGEQVWMAKNLAVTKFNDGTPIPLGSTGSWSSDPTPKYAWFNNNEAAYKDPYGALYNFHTVETGKLCPTGWHVPSPSDWMQLVTSIGGSSQGGKLKEAGTAHWNSPNAGATNESGFGAVGTGTRDPSGIFYGLHQFTFMWLNTSGQFMPLWYDLASAGSGGSVLTAGHPVRCIKD